MDSPLLVGYTPLEHNLFNTLKYIPSVALRGGMATALLEVICENFQDFGNCTKCTKKDDCQFYLFMYQNPFSISNGVFISHGVDLDSVCKDTDLVPVHPLLKQCKRCKSKKNDKLFNYLKKWQDRSIPFLRANCTNPKCKRKTTMDVIGKKSYCKNKSCTKDNCNRIFGTPDTSYTVSTAINYSKNSSLTQYLFSYSYIVPDSIFEAYMLIQENKEVADMIESFEFIRLGRSRSRGFGKTLVKFEELDLNVALSNNKAVITSMLDNNNLIVAAKTHAFRFDVGFDKLESQTNPKLVSNPIIDLNNGLKRIKDKLKLDFTIEDDLFTLEKTLGDIEMVGGWSFKSKQEKPHISMATPGSLYLYRVNPDKKSLINEEFKRALSLLEFFGLSDHSRLGFNLIYYPSQNEFTHNIEAAYRE